MGGVGMVITNFYVIYSARDISAIYFDLERSAVYGTISLVSQIINIFVLIAVAFISFKATKTNRNDLKLSVFYNFLIMAGGVTFACGFHWRTFWLLDTGTLVINFGIVGALVCEILLGKGCADHSNVAGVIYGFIYLGSYSALVTIDSLGSFLFGINEIAPMIYLILPINLIGFALSIYILCR